jgi:hypothetical protein
VSLHHVSEILVGSQTSPLPLRPPVLEELLGPGLAVVVLQLAEGFLEQVSGVEALVGLEQMTQHIAHHDTVRVAFTDGDLVDVDPLRSRVPVRRHLRIKQFCRTSESAVKTPIRKRPNISAGLYEMLQILSLPIFEKPR